MCKIINNFSYCQSHLEQIKRIKKKSNCLLAYYKYADDNDVIFRENDHIFDFKGIINEEYIDFPLLYQENIDNYETNTMVIKSEFKDDFLILKATKDIKNNEKLICYFKPKKMFLLLYNEFYSKRN
jgi:hypothetical protein